MRARAALLVLAGVIAGCGPDPYMPDVPRKPMRLEQGAEVRSFLKMNDPKAPLHFVRDIKNYTEGGVWRWTGKSPTLLLAAPRDRGMKFVALIAIAGATLQDTGAVAIKVSINGHELSTERYDTAGDKRIERPVPDGWLTTQRDNIVNMEIDKVWTSPADGNQLGFVLTAVGFVP